MSDVPLSVGIRTMSVNGLQGVKGTEQRHDDEMRGYMSDIYANYIQFFPPRSMPGMGLGSGKCFLLRGRWAIISSYLELFSFKLAQAL